MQMLGLSVGTDAGAGRLRYLFRFGIEASAQLMATPAANMKEAVAILRRAMPKPPRAMAYSTAATPTAVRNPMRMSAARRNMLPRIVLIGAGCAGHDWTERVYDSDAQWFLGRR